MNRYHFSYGDPRNDEDDNGPHVMYEDVEPIIADRDIKAANLRTLADMVLAMDAAGEAFEQNVDAAKEDTLADAWQSATEGVVALARGLKQ